MLTKRENVMLSDFKQAIKEGCAEYEVEPPEHLINKIMTRVNQDVVSLYEQWGVNDTEFVNALQSVVREALIMYGYSKEVFGGEWNG